MKLLERIESSLVMSQPHLFDGERQEEAKQTDESDEQSRPIVLEASSVETSRMQVSYFVKLVSYADS